MNINILYEDNHLLIVEKPVNIPVQEDRSQDADLLTILKQDLKVRYNKPGNVFLGLVHRLDRPVGGVMVFAKTSKAASRLSDQLRRQTFDRTYLAVIKGEMKVKHAKLEHYLLKDTRKNIVSAYTKPYKNAKKAILEYEEIGSKDDWSLLSIRLHTGRPHQIRVQLAESGHPIYGDQKYGTEVNVKGQQIALWARTITIEHPTKKTEITIHSNPPNEFPWNLWQ